MVSRCLVLASHYTCDDHNFQGQEKKRTSKISMENLSQQKKKKIQDKITVLGNIHVIYNQGKSSHSIFLAENISFMAFFLCTHMCENNTGNPGT